MRKPDQFFQPTAGAEGIDSPAVGWKVLAFQLHISGLSEPAASDQLRVLNDESRTNFQPAAEIWLLRMKDQASASFPGSCGRQLVLCRSASNQLRAV